MREILKYDPDTGRFTWLITKGRRAKAGNVAGYRDAKGYMRVEIDDRSYKLHRLAFLYMTGSWPPDQVDHRDNDKANNAWENLRAANNVGNNANIPVQKNNKLGVKGVHRAGGKYRACIRVGGKLVHLGYFETPEQAGAAYASAAREYFGEFARAS